MADTSDIGILYIATGDEFVAEAELSAQSVREVMPDIPIAIVTDGDPNFDFDYNITITDPDYSFADQISNLCRSPFKRTLYLDTDICMYDDISELFDILERFDIGIAYNHNGSVFDPEGVPDSFPEYNTGVVAYNNNEEFFKFTKAWEKNYNKLLTDANSQNQPSFRKTLYESDLRIGTIRPEYNLMLRYPGHALGTVKLFHGRLIDIETPGAGKYVDVETAAKKVNSTSEHRVFTQLGGFKVYSNNESNIINRMRMAIWRYGFIESCRRGVSKIRRLY